MVTADTLPSSSAPSHSHAPRQLLRRTGAVLAGLVAIFAVTTATDGVMHLSGVFPPMDAPPMSNALFLFAFAYRFVYDVAGCYLTAKLAPSRPLWHAMVLGGIGLCLSIAGAVAMWGAGPAWYPLALATSALPCAWLGGRLAQRR
ncbi:hypothetical protein [Hyalangium versicolor]|uniref:hypothetical protein n=1 Tax=Hyalangium versicolor TaxID=2861190 RepID=UPI001CCC1DF1|nr:hypothetical protein [Hyalangium versicolor]